MKYDPKSASLLPVQALAYIGDAVYELYVREKILELHPAKSGKLHGYSIQFAKAKYQAQQAVKLVDQLPALERDILMRGRNADQGSMAKNVSPAEYRWASGLETLLGYLYLSDQSERLQVLLQQIMEDGLKDASI